MLISVDSCLERTCCNFVKQSTYRSFSTIKTNASFYQDYLNIFNFEKKHAITRLWKAVN